MSPIGTSSPAPDILDVAGRRIARRAVPGRAPAILWLGGYRSDMTGTKAERLAAFAAREGLAFCRFDYSGHGASGGRFEDGTLSRWIEEAEAVLAAMAPGPVILAGSSMGAWVALRLVQIRRAAPAAQRIAGLLLLAPAPDFTHRLVLPGLSEAQMAALERDGVVREPSAYSPEPDLYTRALIEDGARNLVMTGIIETGCPIHIIQGMADRDVPHGHAIDLVTYLPADGVVLTLVPGGDHRLSRDADLLRMETALAGLVAEAHSA